ncbi:MAG TPA: hypothetical protein VGQ55_06360 [Pyrinomonadaceae bacterium]|jgi:hypothetical protein|nr:hypothetical protein [Pyrinomonadaceae bacterium]
MQRYRAQNTKYRRPFWLPASNFYVLAAAATIAVFFLIWGILHDGGEDTPFIPAGLGASVVLGSAVILREVILRRARNRFLATQRSLDRSISKVAARRSEESQKLTLERNSTLLRLIVQKSEAAKTLGRLSEAHREVFDLCEEYLAVTHRELPLVGVGSPRLAAIRRGQDKAENLRHYHLLNWAAIESRSLMQDARNRSKISERLDTAQKALGVVESALHVYPHEFSLQESENVLREFIASIKVSDFIEKAERAAFKGNSQRAISHYKDALFELERSESASNEARESASAKIRTEIVQLEALVGEAHSGSDVSNPKKKNTRRK